MVEIGAGLESVVWEQSYELEQMGDITYDVGLVFLSVEHMTFGRATGAWFLSGRRGLWFRSGGRKTAARCRFRRVRRCIASVAGTTSGWLSRCAAGARARGGSFSLGTARTRGCCLRGGLGTYGDGVLFGGVHAVWERGSALFGCL